jgi:hypothetical protein
MIRLPEALDNLKKVYKSTVGLEEFTSLDMAKALKLKNNVSGGFYRRLNSFLVYGLIEARGRGKFAITQLGKDILFPDNEETRKECYKRAVFNVPLWNSLHEKIGNTKYASIFSQLKAITNAEPLEIQNKEETIREWYFDDIALLDDNTKKSFNDLIDESMFGRKSFIANNTTKKDMEVPSVTSNDTEEISVFEYSFIKPKDEDLQTAFNNFKAYMDVKINQLKVKSSKQVSTKDENNSNTQSPDN